jgi:aminopeptidase YwaD
LDVYCFARASCAPAFEADWLVNLQAHSYVSRVNSSRGLLGLLLFAALFFFGACAQNPTEPSESHIRDTIRFLASDAMMGRESGTPFAHSTALYLRKRYIELGLSPAFENGFTQEFPFQGGLEAGPAFADAEGKRLEGIPLPFAESGEARGVAVFARFCLDDSAAKRDDFDGLEIEGKIVFCLRYGPQGSTDPKFSRSMSFENKWQAAVKRKAAAVVFVGKRGSEPPALGDFPRRGGKAPALYVPMEKALSFAGWLEEEEKLLAEGKPSVHAGPICSSSNVCPEVQVSARYQAKQKTGFNVGAYLTPPRPAQKDIIVGAHLDHLGLGSFSSMGGRGQIHNGADDNASGTAAVLELARLLRARIASGDLKLPGDRNILFAHFDAEERGLFGSMHMAQKLKADRTLLMVNLDMVGRLRADKGLSIQGKDTSDPRLKEILELPGNSALVGARIKLISGGRGPSDHASFYMRGLPVVFLFTGYHMQYHKPSDDTALLNMAGIAQIVNYTARIVESTAALNPPPEFRSAGKEEEDRGYSFKLRLGIMPGGYERGGDGLLVAGIQKGAPVGKTGIREGDKLVQIGEQKVSDIYDLMEFLGDAEPNVDYRIVFMRGKERMTGATTLITE